MTRKDTVQNFRAEISDFKIALDLEKIKVPLMRSKKIPLKYGIIYIKRCVLKKLSQEKKHFEKSSSLPEKWSKNWPKTAILPYMAFFTSFWAISQARMKIFGNAFVPWLSFFHTHLLMYIMPYFGEIFFTS